MSDNTFCTECANMEIHCGTMLCARYNAVCYIYKMNHPGDCPEFIEKSEPQKAAEATRYCWRCKHRKNGSYHCKRHQNPLDGSPLDCATARLHDYFCGLGGRHFEKD